LTRVAHEIGANPREAAAKGRQVIEQAQQYNQLTAMAQNACRAASAAAGEAPVTAGYGRLGEALVTAVTGLGRQAAGVGGRVVTAAGMAAETDLTNAGGFHRATGTLPSAHPTTAGR
jgi:hypothetical protein